MKYCLILSVVGHLICIYFFSFSFSSNSQLNTYSVNFLGSILKETDLLFSAYAVDSVSKNHFPLSIFLLPKQGKSIKLYNKDTKKPFVSLGEAASKNYISEIYKLIESKIESKRKAAQVKVDVPEVDWEEIKLKIE